jgi:hypothetical protein
MRRGDEITSWKGCKMSLQFEKVGFDSLAIGVQFRCGGTMYRKITPMISQNIKTGELLYDARIEYPKAEQPIVEICLNFLR